MSSVDPLTISYTRSIVSLEFFLVMRFHLLYSLHQGFSSVNILTLYRYARWRLFIYSHELTAFL
jgi:hypothetical protein